MSDTGTLLASVALALFAFFVAAPMLLNALSLFGVQKRFAEEMIEKNIIDRDSVKKYHPKKELAGVVVSLVILAVLFLTVYKTAPYGYICGGLPFIAGLLKYRAILQYNSLTVKRFRNIYQSMMDKKKFDEYVRKNF